MTSDELLLLSDTARVLGVAESTVRRLEQRGELVATRSPGGTRIFSGDDVRKLAAQRKQDQKRN
jgi:excisionase family DNA binding protein